MSSYQKTTLSIIPIEGALANAGELLLDIKAADAHRPPPVIIDDYSLAMHLGVRCRTVWYCVTQRKHMYQRFTIPKSNGKKRVLHAPKRILKFLQKRIHRLILDPLPLGDQVGAYVKGRGCLHSAQRHSGHTVRVAMDLKDFFPHHSEARVRNFFMRHYGYSKYVSGLLATLCTVEEKNRRVTPQGSPASPTLCNLIAQEALDGPVLKHLEGTGWIYTRYSDDITLSHPERKTRAEVDQLIADMRRLIKAGGYRTNFKKTKVQRQHWRQKMLGIVVNKHPNIPRDVYLRYRAILHNCLVQGFVVNAARYDPHMDAASFQSHLLGKISYFSSINPVKAQKLRALYDQAVEAHGG